MVGGYAVVSEGPHALCETFIVSDDRSSLSGGDVFDGME
jgi:hypothetical protein